MDKLCDKLCIEDFLNYRFVSGLENSPSGVNTALIVSTMDKEQNKYLNNLWLLAGRDAKPLTYSGDVMSFIWTGDDEILFPALRKDSDKEAAKKGEKLTVYHRLSLKGGEAAEAFRVPYSVSQIEKIDDKLFAMMCDCKVGDYDFASMDEAAKAQAFKDIEDEKDYEVLDEIPFWANGGGFTNKCRSRLFIYDSASGSMEAVTDELDDIGELNVKGRKLCFTANHFRDKKTLKDAAYCYDIDTKQTECLVEDGKYSIGSLNFFGEGFIMEASLNDKHGMNQNYSLYTIVKGEVKLLREIDENIGSVTNSDTRLYGGATVRVYKDEFYYTVVDHVQNALRKVSADGSLTTILQRNETVDGFDVGPDGIVFYGLGALTLHEVFRLEDGNPVKITSLNDDSLKGKKLSTPERFDVQGEAETVEGFVFRPTEFDGGKKYPAILNVHGGPKTAYGDTFFHEMQVMANMGYFVLICNPWGSEGRGNKFADLRGKYGTIDYNDLMTYVDKAMEAYPQIDKDRLCVTGGSYGGFMTNWVIGHTDRFCCAASQRSISNWISKFGTTDIGYFFNADQILSTPWDNHDKMWWHSPMKYADKCVTPTLFIHSEEDYRCWIAEGIQMFTSLRYHGVEARLCMFRGENHELSRSGKPKHRIRRLTEIMNWFEKHVRS